VSVSGGRCALHMPPDEVISWDFHQLTRAIQILTEARDG
jgi:hypothetical protein